MNTYISLLRGINVSGQKQIRMADLQRLYADIGLTRVRTYVQSGNVLFDADPAIGRAALARQIEAQIQTAYGFEVPVLIREAADLQRIVDSNPFLTQRHEDTARLYVHFLAEPPQPELVAKLTTPANESGEWIMGEQEIFLFLPGGAGRTKLTNAYLENKLKNSATARNWNTVNALLKMALE
jgi:uncharacterized protein (DUF1697 family)